MIVCFAASDFRSPGRVSRNIHQQVVSLGPELLFLFYFTHTKEKIKI